LLKVCSSMVEIRTHGPMKFFDVTETLEKFVEKCNVSLGVLRLDVKGATPALLLLDPSEAEELLKVLRKLVPFSGWRHGNAYAHLLSTILTTSLTLAIENSRLILPERTRVLLLETRSVYNHRRTIFVVVVGR